MNEALIKKLRLPQGGSVLVIQPPEGYLQEQLENNEDAKAVFERLAPSHRKAYINWIEEAKREETRTSRLENTVEKLRLGRKNPSDKG
ncbi:YdeI/OmpD-associated family protein [Paenibacillus sp. BR2-3]|uniref:YdeI/OmpD-associated family protein n=1 Tax=Paenibacillus sp. BR2-3 TaxID=3048494 RepID=UPI0039776608